MRNFESIPLAPFGRSGRSARSVWAGRLAFAARAGLGLTFAAAGVYKLASLAAFAGIVGDYGLLPKFLHFPTALALGLTETLAGAGLVLNRRYCLEIVAALLVLFMCVLGYGLVLGLGADCGCFSPADPETIYHGGMRRALWRDAAFLAVCAFLFWRRRLGERQHRRSVGPNPKPASGGNPT
jgi:lysylphosphatidylglycerol synthetase-like protein (DUF2156 family)